MTETFARVQQALKAALPSVLAPIDDGETLHSTTAVAAAIAVSGVECASHEKVNRHQFVYLLAGALVRLHGLAPAVTDALNAVVLEAAKAGGLGVSVQSGPAGEPVVSYSPHCDSSSASGSCFTASTFGNTRTPT